VDRATSSRDLHPSSRRPLNLLQPSTPCRFLQHKKTLCITYLFSHPVSLTQLGRSDRQSGSLNPSLRLRSIRCLSRLRSLESKFCESFLITNQLKLTWTSSHFNTAHFRNPDFQPEEWTPCAEYGTSKSGRQKHS
jgi:hypothetical protein